MRSKLLGKGLNMREPVVPAKAGTQSATQSDYYFKVMLMGLGPSLRWDDDFLVFEQPLLSGRAGHGQLQLSEVKPLHRFKQALAVDYGDNQHVLFCDTVDHAITINETFPMC